MFADCYYESLHFDKRDECRPRRRSHIFMAALVFLAAYFTTVTVRAQPQDEIQLNENKIATVVGTVKEADENFVIISSAGKDLKIVLDRVHLRGAADTVFSRGMTVRVDGTMEGDDFGLPLMKAKSITATSPAVPLDDVQP